MPRASTRKRAIKARAALREADADEDIDSEVDRSDEGFVEDDTQYAASPPSKKQKRRSVGSGARGTKGALKGILDLPLEVFVHIVSQLDLPTVFHLSRLSKRFYSLLRDAALEYIWEWAREASGLPELTDPLDTVQYANLLFGGHCQGCGKATVKVDYVLRVRYCQKCAKEFLWDDRDWFNAPSDEVIELCPCSDRDGSGRHRNHREYLLRDLKNCRSVIDHFEWAEEAADDHEEPVEQHINFEVVDDDAFFGFAEWTFDEWAERCVDIRDGRAKDADAIIEWQLQRQGEKEQERQKLRESRRKAIEEHLQELGWHPHHFDTDEWKTHSLVNLAKDFNDNVWRAVRAPLEGFLRERAAQRDAAFVSDVSVCREDERRYEHSQLSGDEVRSKALGLYPLPRWEDFCKVEAVWKLWTVDSIDDAYNEDIPTIVGRVDAISRGLAALKHAFGAAMFPRVVEVLRNVEQKAVLDALRLFPKPDKGDEFGEDQQKDVFAMACAALKCNECDIIDAYPHILNHCCKSRLYAPAKPASTDPRMYRIPEEQVEAALSMLDAAGLAPNSAYAVVDELGATISCAAHPAEGTALPWHNMVSHMTGHGLLGTHELVVESREATLERLLRQASRSICRHLEGLRWFGKRGEDVES